MQRLERQKKGTYNVRTNEKIKLNRMFAISAFGAIAATAKPMPDVPPTMTIVWPARVVIAVLGSAARDGPLFIAAVGAGTRVIYCAADMRVMTFDSDDFRLR